MLERRFVKTIATIALIALVALALQLGQSKTAHSANALDVFGIKEIYPTKDGGNEWFVNMDDPTSDSMFRNLPPMTKQSDGSWQVSKDEVRMEAWSPPNNKWLNVEITEYAKIIKSSDDVLQMYARGGHHTESDPCLGSAIKARLYGDGTAAWVKELTHPAYTDEKGITKNVVNEPLDGRWVGFKAIIYNVLGSDGKTYVHMESYVDDDVTGRDGNLEIKNDWHLASVYNDTGQWETPSPDFTKDCFPVDLDNSGKDRQRDEIISMPGGTDTQNLVAFRSDTQTWQWKYLSVREISANGSSNAVAQQMQMPMLNGNNTQNQQRYTPTQSNADSMNTGFSTDGMTLAKNVKITGVAITGDNEVSVSLLYKGNTTTSPSLAIIVMTNHKQMMMDMMQRSHGSDGVGQHDMSQGTIGNNTTKQSQGGSTFVQGGWKSGVTVKVKLDEDASAFDAQDVQVMVFQNTT